MRLKWIVALILVTTSLACSSVTISIDPTAVPEIANTTSASEPTPDQPSGDISQPVDPTLPPDSSSEPTAEAVASGDSPVVGGCPIFPSDHIWNTRVDTLLVDPNSDAYIESIGSDVGLHPDFGAGEYEGGPIGIPFTFADANTPRVDVSFEYDDESDAGPYPIPEDAPIEGGAESDGDRHILVVETDECKLYELYYAFPAGDGNWEAGSGAIWDLRDYALRPDEWTSADAAGLPILPGLIRYNEVAAGEIRHAIRFTADETQETYVWPARHKASDITDTDVPPMGQRFRLKASFDISPYPVEMQVILQAMKTYGLILADNGSDWFISGAPDDRWNNDELVPLFREITGDNFEAVDVSGLMIDYDSGQAEQP